MEMGDHDHDPHQYELPDLQLFRARRLSQFPGTHDQQVAVAAQTSDQTFLPHRNNIMAHPYNYHEPFTHVLSNGNGYSMAIPSGLVTFGLGHDHFPAAAGDQVAAAAAAASTAGATSVFGVEMENGGWSLRNTDGGGNSRWPRQETLTLLEIRSKLDSKFKEANHKGPLWDEVSRIMAEEHGYRRSGKKCREKFENLYKYYKKTREGKAGKNYRFFRQLEALYGTETRTNYQSAASVSAEANNQLLPQENYHHPQEQKTSSDQSLSFFNPSDFDTSTSFENNNVVEDDDVSAIALNQNNGSSSSSSSWKTKVVKEIVETQMKKLMEAQDVWMERVLKTIEDRENERMSKEEEWRRKEMARLEKEHELWVKVPDRCCFNGGFQQL